jgi:ATP-dependent Lon protease
MFESFLFHRWNKIILRAVNWLLGAIFLGLLVYKFRVYNTIEYPFSNHKDYRIDGTFFPYVFFLILFYFYFLFTEWLIKKITTYRVNQVQFLQVLQEKKLVVNGHEYQIEKIDKLKISFYPQTVNFQGILIIPQEDSHLKLDFSANTSLDYYNQQLFDHLQGTSPQIGKKKFSLIWIFFHLVLLIFFFGYLFITTPFVIMEAKRRRQPKIEEPIISSDQEQNWLFRLKSELFPPHIKRAIQGEIRKLEKMHPWASGRDVQEKYIEDLMSLPWWQTSAESRDLAKAQAELDRSHSGLKKVKKRIIEHLAGQQKSKRKQAPVICLVGPPGTGKTSLAQSIARATGRKFARISVGGISDEGEIRGHRKTYVASTFGKIIQGIKQAGTINALLLIDEIDKVSQVTGLHGNPSAALLEVLDPEQNEKFNDHYLGQGIPYDLSKIMFICTANNLENIPGPLQDRMEIIQLPPYTTLDKIQIAKSHLIPKTLAEHGLEKNQLTFTDEAIEEIIRFYIHSGGTRAPERVFGWFAEKFALKQIKDNLESEKIDLAKVRQYLGARIVELEAIDYDEPGIVNGLAWTEFGGVVLSIEVNCYPGKGDLKLTGNLGKTMQESAQAALSYLRDNYRQFGLDYHLFKENDICIHVPKGGVPKDGPSAGIVLTTAIISALKKKTVPYSIAMTGEITSKGRVFTIGGLHEKLVAAYEHKLKTVFIPQGNEKHLEDVPSLVKNKLEIVPVKNYSQVWDKVKSTW